MMNAKELISGLYATFTVLTLSLLTHLTLNTIWTIDKLIFDCVVY